MARQWDQRFAVLLLQSKGEVAGGGGKKGGGGGGGGQTKICHWVKPSG